MKVLIIGATGTAGSAIVKAAVTAGDQVTANGRSSEKLAELQEKFPTITTLAKDAFALTQSEVLTYDVVIDAFSAPTKPYLQIDLAAHLVHLVREQESPRLAFILGAGSLHTGADHHLVIDDLAKAPGAESWIAIPESQLYELDYLKNVKNVAWFGLSPAQEFLAGPADDHPLIGQEELLVNDQGESKTTSGTLAAAIVQEYHQPKYLNQRFTVANH